MKASGLMIKQTVKALILTLMEPNMSENGRMTNKMGWESRNGLMDNVTKVSIKTVQRQEKEY